LAPGPAGKVYGAPQTLLSRCETGQEGAKRKEVKGQDKEEREGIEEYKGEGLKD